MYGYCISAGEGTLIEYGVRPANKMAVCDVWFCDDGDCYSCFWEPIMSEGDRITVRWRPCDNECETAK